MGDSTTLGTSSKDGLLQRRLIKPQLHFIFAEGNDLLMHVLEGAVAKESTIGNSHNQEKPGIVIEQSLMLLGCCSKPAMQPLASTPFELVQHTHQGTAYTMLSGSRLFLTQRWSTL